MWDGAALEASRGIQGWFEQHKALQDDLWTEYMKSLRVIRRGDLTVGRLKGLGTLASFWTRAPPVAF